MNKSCFKKSGWVYIPIHPAGIFVTTLAIVFMVPVIIATVRNDHSISDDLYTLFVFASCTVFWWKWIAEKHPKKSLPKKALIILMRLFRNRHPWQSKTWVCF